MALGRVPWRKVLIIWLSRWLISSRGTESRRLSFEFGSVLVEEVGVCETVVVDWI